MFGLEEDQQGKIYQLEAEIRQLKRDRVKHNETIDKIIDLLDVPSVDLEPERSINNMKILNLLVSLKLKEGLNE